MNQPNSMVVSFDYQPPLDPYLEIVYADASILVLSKQSGLLSVPGKAPEHADCLETRAQQEFPEALTVHRLDRGTSGLVVMGLGKNAHRHLSIQFQKRQTSKTYIAEVWGVVPQQSGSIEMPLRCDWPNRPKQMVDYQLGKDAVTHWKRIAVSRDTSRMELRPVTGRSHQLRVHMQQIGHPILGDNFYANEPALSAADRLLLHASHLTFRHPEDGRTMAFEAPCTF